MIIHNGIKKTPNEVAKELIADKLDIAVDYWTEDHLLDYEAMTEKESDAVHDLIIKRANGVLKYLGFDPYYKNYYKAK